MSQLRCESADCCLAAAGLQLILWRRRTHVVRTEHIVIQWTIIIKLVEGRRHAHASKNWVKYMAIVPIILQLLLSHLINEHTI